MAWLARSRAAERLPASRAAGMKNPVSRKFSAGGKRPVRARWLMAPSATTLSTDT